MTAFADARLFQPGEAITLPSAGAVSEHQPVEYLLVVMCSCGGKHLVTSIEDAPDG